MDLASGRLAVGYTKDSGLYLQYFYCLLFNVLFSYLNCRMPNKCCVTDCKGNYDSSKEAVSVFRFPKDPEDRENWVQALKNKPKFELRMAI